MPKSKIHSVRTHLTSGYFNKFYYEKLGKTDSKENSDIEQSHSNPIIQPAELAWESERINEYSLYKGNRYYWYF